MKAEKFELNNRSILILYLKGKYVLQINQLNNLIWLKNSDYLNDNELNSFKNKLIGKQNDNKIEYLTREE